MTILTEKYLNMFLIRKVVLIFHHFAIQMGIYMQSLLHKIYLTKFMKQKFSEFGIVYGLKLKQHNKQSSRKSTYKKKKTSAHLWIKQCKKTDFIRFSCVSNSGFDLVESQFISRQIGLIQKSYRCQIRFFPNISKCTCAIAVKFSG